MHTGQQRGLEANDRYKMLWDLYVSHLLKAKKQKKDQRMSIIKQVLGSTVLFKKFTSKFQIYLGEIHTDIDLCC